MDDRKITDINRYPTSGASSTTICYVKCESMFGSSSSVKGVIIRKTKMGASDIIDLNLNELSGSQSAPICCKKNESIFKSNPKEVIRNVETGNIDIINFNESSAPVYSKNKDKSISKSTPKEGNKMIETTDTVNHDLNFEESSDILSKKEKSNFKSSPKGVNFRHYDIGNIDSKESNKFSGTLSTLICHKDDSTFKSSPKEVSFIKPRIDYIDIKDLSSNKLSSIVSTSIYNKKDDSTFKSNSKEAMSISSFDASSCNIDDLYSIKSYLSETDLSLEEDNSNSNSVCSLSDEECIKILFDDDWKTDDDSCDNVIDDELVERLLSFDVPQKCDEDQTDLNFRMIKNETLKRKMICDLKNEEEDKSLLENVDDEVLDRSKRLCLHASCDEVTLTILDEMFMKINFQNLCSRFSEEDSMNKILELFNCNLSSSKIEMNINLKTPSIIPGEMFADKVNQTVNNEENSNGSMIFSWTSENEDDNSDVSRKYDLKEREMSRNNNLGNIKRLFYAGEAHCDTHLFPLTSSTYEDQLPQSDCMSKRSSLSESSGSKMMQISGKMGRKENQSNISDIEYCIDYINEPCFPDLKVRSRVGRRYFWEYLKRRTKSLCATYEKLKNEIILSSHVA